MSQTNTQGEDNDQRDPVADDFDFYFPFAKTLALDLPTPEDTSIAAAWVQKLEAEPESEEEKRTRLNYLKLLLFVLQRGRLSGIFRKQPPSGALQPFPQGLTVLDVGNLMLDQDDSPTCGQGDARCLPYMTELSNDLREFVAAQEIPDFGVQMYYAWSSDEPVHKWLGFDEEKFPQFVLDKIKQLKEVKSDEKSTTTKDGCELPKTGCDIPLMDKSAKKKVKSPQEIEKSQGRSFHTYVGLMGQMGNFNDKCGDDQDKCPRPEQRKTKCARRNLQKEYMGSGGGAEEMATVDELASFLAGPSPVGRPCCCPAMGGRPHYPDSCGKGPEQNFQDPAAFTFPIGDRTQAENTQWITPGLESTRLMPRQYNEEPCTEGSPAQPLQVSQRRSASPRSKGTSANRPNYDCSLQDDGGFCKRDAVCCCTSPPCTCPCPRAVPQQPTRKTPSSMASSAPGGRIAAESSIPCGRPSGGGYRMNREEPPQGAGPAPSGAARSGGSPRPSSRSKSPQVVHCFDNESPDPFLSQAMSKLDSLSWSEDGDCSAFSDDLIKDYFAVDKSPPPAFQRLSSPQRELYDSCQPQQQQPKSHPPVCPVMKPKVDRCSPPQAQVPRTPPPARAPRAPSPGPRQPRQPPQEPQQQCRPNQQFAPPPQARPQGDVCAPSQAGNQSEDPYAFLDKFPPDCGLTPPPFENVFRRPPAEAWTPDSPHWNQPENLYEFVDKFSPNLDGSGFTGLSFSDDDCGRTTLDTTSSSRNGSHLEDMYALLEKRFPPNIPACAPSKPSRPRSAMNDVCGRPPPEQCQPQNQAENMYAFPPSGPAPSPAGFAAKSNRQRPDTCPPLSQTGNQPEDLYAFLEKNFPPRAPAPCPQNRKSGRMNNMSNLLQGMNQRREAHREKCDTSGPRRSQGPDSTFCMQPGQPQGGVCSAEGGMMSVCCGESRAPRSPMFPDSGVCRRHPGIMDRSNGGPPNGACQNLRPPYQSKNATFASSIHPPSPHPMGQPYEEDEDECESSESLVDLGPKESMSMYGMSCPTPRGPGRPPQQGNAQLFERQKMMQGRSAQQQQCPVVWQEMQSRCSRPVSQRTGPSDSSRLNAQADMRSCAPQRVAPWKTPERELCTHSMGEVQKSAPKTISQGKTCGQEINIHRGGNVEACPRKMAAPRKAVDENCNEAWATMQSTVPQTDSKMTDEQCNQTWVEMRSRNPQTERGADETNKTWVPMPSRDPQTERRAEETNKTWVTMPSREPQTERGAEEENKTRVTKPSREPQIERDAEETNKTWVTMPSRDAQMERRVVEENNTWVTMPSRDPQTERRAEETNKTWVTMPSRDPQLERRGVEENNTWVTMPSRDPQTERRTVEENNTWVTMPSRDPQTEKPRYETECNLNEEAQKESLSGRTSARRVSAPGAAPAATPNTWASFRRESRKSGEPDNESCPPQNLPPGPPARPGEVTEDWPRSGRDSCEDDGQPLWVPLEPSSKSGAEGPVPKEPGTQRKVPSGKPANQEPAAATRRTSPRSQPSKSKLSRQKSSSRTYESLTDSQSRSVRKSYRSPSKSETRSGNYAATKLRPKTKSETRMKITSESATGKIKPETQTKIGSETRMKSRMSSKQKIKSVPRDPTFENKRRTSRTSSKEQERGPLCRIQMVQDSAERLASNCRGNPYMEKSLAYHKARQAEAPCYGPMEFPYSGLQGVTTIYQDNSPCDYDDEDEPVQMKFCEDQTENGEYIPLCSQNADLSVGSFFDIPETVPQNAQCQQQTYYLPCPTNHSRNAPQGVSLQTFQDESSDVYCDETESSSYRIYYD